MKSIYFIRSIAFILSVLFSVGLFAQGKAKIYIKKTENGVVSEQTQEVDLAAGQDIQSILKDLGILDEFGQLKDGQSFSINIDKFDGSDNQNINMLVMPPLPPSPPTWEGDVEHAFLGVMLKKSYSDQVADQGVVISEVIEGTAAETAGLEPGDIIVELDNQSMTEVEEVVDYIQSKAPGDKISIEIIRGEKKSKIKAVLGTREEDYGMWAPTMMGPGFEPQDFDFKFDDDSIMILCPSSPNCICPNDSMKICMPFSWKNDGLEEQETPFLGVTPSADQLESGVKVMVVEESAAKTIGLLDNDVITDFNGKKVNSFDELAEEIGATEPGETIALTVLRDGKTLNLSGEIGKRSYSGCNDIRIFRDFKGMDEDGSYFFDYEFDMDKDNLEMQMEELMKQLEMQQDRLRQELDKLHENRMTMEIEIVIEEITPEEASIVNQNKNAHLETDNDLSLDKITFFPNPGNGLVNLSFQTSDKGDLSIVIYDQKGNTVYLEQVNDFTGSYSNLIDITSHSDGAYYLQITQNGKTYSKKLIKG